MNPAIIVVGVVIVIIVLVLVRPQRAIGVSSLAITVKKDATVTFTSQLLYKSWFKRTLKPIRGKINQTASNTIMQVTPANVTTTRPSRSGTFTIIGLAVGTGKIVLNGSSRKGTHSVAKISVTVI